MSNYGEGKEKRQAFLRAGEERSSHKRWIRLKKLDPKRPFQPPAFINA
jgi:hypothetical protein